MSRSRERDVILHVNGETVAMLTLMKSFYKAPSWSVCNIATSSLVSLTIFLGLYGMLELTPLSGDILHPVGSPPQADAGSPKNLMEVFMQLAENWRRPAMLGGQQIKLRGTLNPEPFRSKEKDALALPQKEALQPRSSERGQQSSHQPQQTSDHVQKSLEGSRKASESVVKPPKRLQEQQSPEKLPQTSGHVPEQVQQTSDKGQQTSGQVQQTSDHAPKQVQKSVDQAHQKTPEQLEQSSAHAEKPPEILQETSGHVEKPPELAGQETDQGQQPLGEGDNMEKAAEQSAEGARQVQQPPEVVQQVSDPVAVQPAGADLQGSTVLDVQAHGLFTSKDRGSDVWHSWTDEELFQKAIAVGDPPPDASGPPKVAFLFLVRSDIPLAPVWERYLEGQEGYFSVYVHCSEPYFQMSRERKLFWGRQIPNPTGEVSRFHFSMVDAERRLYGNAMLDPLNQHFILVSEACIPIRPFPGLYKFLGKSQQSHVESYVTDGTKGKSMWRKKLGKFVPWLMFRKGSQWKEMNRRHVRIVVEDKVYWEPIKSKWLTADEHYIPSLFQVLGMSGETTGQSLTHVDWTIRGEEYSHPRQYKKEEITPSLITELQKKSKYTYFARKFGEDALEPLLEILDGVENVFFF